LILFLPAGLERPGQDLLESVAVVDGGVKENNVGAPQVLTLATSD
jgi:hypothetical protein